MDDRQINCQNELDPHGQYTQAYINILNAYTDQIKSSVNSKNTLKTNFFNLIKKIMLALVFLFGISVIISFVVFSLMIKNNYQSVAVITGAVTAMLSTFSTMMLSIFKLPKIIADYLFNKEEDKQMNEIIKNIQRYEIDAVKMENRAKVDSEKEIVEELNGDLSLGQSPNINGTQPQSSTLLHEENESNTVDESA